MTIESEETTRATLPIEIQYSLSDAQRERLSTLRGEIEELAEAPNRDVAVPYYYGTVLESVLDLVEEIESNPERSVAADFDPDAYDPPASAWRAGPPFGTLIRNKGGGRAVVRRDPDSSVDDPGATDAATVVASFVEDGGLDRAGATGARGRSGEPGSFERAWEALTRERYRRFVGHDAVDRTAAREALATATGRRADG